MKRISLVRRIAKTLVLIFVAVVSVVAYFLYPPEPRAIAFPGGKQFAFSIVDDTDLATLERVKPLYELLYRYGIRTTKTVWVLESNEPAHSPNRGDSLRDPAYLSFILDLKSKGFEIALHGVRGGEGRVVSGRGGCRVPGEVDVGTWLKTGTAAASGRSTR